MTTTDTLTESYCDACGRRDSWGCGHSGSQRRDARRHKLTRVHLTGRCWHYNHDDCTVATCRTPGLRTPGYASWTRHLDVPQPPNDSRYSIMREYTGNPVRPWVLRFCGDWILGADTYSDAALGALAHKYSRDNPITPQLGDHSLRLDPNDESTLCQSCGREAIVHLPY
jgi:hypothetical protein